MPVDMLLLVSEGSGSSSRPDVLGGLKARASPPELQMLAVIRLVYFGGFSNSETNVLWSVVYRN
jgi:hypothetical protein